MPWIKQDSGAVIRHNHDALRYSKMLERHVDVATFLAAQGLTFRAHDETNKSSSRENFHSAFTKK